MAYGSMGGDGQPQTQAAIFSRYVFEDIDIESAIAQGRWLLGRAWGDQEHNIKMEEEVYDRVGKTLQQQGHDIAVVSNHSQLMGHAGAVIVNANGDVNASTDPRCDGAALV